MHPHQGWPKRDFDIIGNEGAIPSGEVTNLYKPQNAFTENEDGHLTVYDVKWLTVLRHPYTRTLSHYHHLKRIKATHNLTLEEFLTDTTRGGFGDFMSNQQTRWTCGTGACVDTRKSNIVTRDMLDHAIGNLEKMHAVLILEQMSSPQSCTRRQMRHVLNFTTVESFSDPHANNVTKIRATSRSAGTNWEKVIRPYLNDTGRSNNHTALTGFDGVAMAAMGLNNDMDMQLYGYALHLCEALADKYERESNASIAREAPAIDVIPTMVPLHNTTANGSYVAATHAPKAISEDYLRVDDLPKYFSIHTGLVILMLVVCRQFTCRSKGLGGSPRSGSSHWPHLDH